MKSFTKSILLSVLFLVSLNANTMNIQTYNSEILYSLVQATKTTKNSIPNIAKDICAEVEKRIGKSILDSKDSEIQFTIIGMGQDLQTRMYDSLTIDDKKLALEGLVANFFNRENKDSLSKFIDMLMFVAIKGQTFEELKPLIEKHYQDLEWLKQQKSSRTRGAVRILSEFKDKAQSIFKSTPESVKEKFKEIGKNTQLNLSVTKAYKPSASIWLASKAIVSQIDKNPDLTDEQRAQIREFVPFVLDTIQFRLDQPTSRL